MAESVDPDAVADEIRRVSLSKRHLNPDDEPMPRFAFRHTHHQQQLRCILWEWLFCPYRRRGPAEASRHPAIGRVAAGVC
jgi:hypothetical protein